ncbi:DNA-binding protein [Labedaea rhizosphaerae]|uniref:DNA-binding protein n=1 Tax=Labedaea rhizosphaerae TaxID=598644 RepID=UPI00105E378D|nr:DNA-binding protein [Labedaea rhizosphaerae]
MINQTPANGPAFYTIKQAAWLLGVSVDAVARDVRVGLIPVVRRRSRSMIPAAVINRRLVKSVKGGDA